LKSIIQKLGQVKFRQPITEVYPFQEVLTQKIFESNSADENGKPACRMQSGRGKLPRIVRQEIFGWGSSGGSGFCAEDLRGLGYTSLPKQGMVRRWASIGLWVWLLSNFLFQFWDNIIICLFKKGSNFI